MAGIVDHNFPAFFAAAAILRKHGHTVVNPAEIPQPDSVDWSDFMRRDIPELCKCDTIFLLTGWHKLEFHIAQQLGMTVAFQTPYYTGDTEA